MYTNADCTVYLQTCEGYERVPVQGVFWDDTRAKNYNKTGSNNVDSVRVFIGLDQAELPLNPEKAYIIRGLCGIEADDTKGLTGLLKAGALTITSVAKRDFGSPVMRHWEVGAK